MQKRILNLAILAYFLLPLSLPGQDFMMQGWYWDYPKTADGANWANNLQNKTQELSEAGFTHVWLPPLSRASFGSRSNGYDPKDLFDLGEFGQGPTGFGSRADVDNLITAFQAKGIKAIADVVYNHRDGGAPEENPAVAGWIRNMNFNKIQAGDRAYPSDRFRIILPVGGNTGLGAGTYFFKFGSKSGHPNFHNKPYKVYMETNTRGFQGQPNLWEFEPNGGGGCGQPNNVIELGRDMFANIDAFGCTIDEFALTINPGDYDPNGDVLYIYMSNRNVGGLDDYSDHTVLELYYTGGGGNLENRLTYQTYTDFTNLPSGQGAMNWPNFKPNGNPTQLRGNGDDMFFFYDYDQNVQSTRDVLFDWTRWLWNDAGIRGYRLDAVKEFPANFVGDLLDNLHDNNIKPDMVVGEFFDGNTGALKGWIDEVYANMDNDTKAAITPRLFDFSLRFNLEAASDAFGYDVRNLFNASMVDAEGMSGFNVVTFTDNHDFRGSTDRIDNDPILAYAYILTNNQIGLPCVFYDDYYGKGLKPQIDQLIDIHKNYIFGAGQRDYLSMENTSYTQNFTLPEGETFDPRTTTLLYQLSGGVGGQDIIVAINYAGVPLDVVHGVNVSTLDLAVGSTLTELTGNGGNTVVAANGTARFQLPARSYGVWLASAPPPPNAFPTANAGQDATYECTGEGGTSVTLDGSASSDPDGDALSYSWAGPFGTASGETPSVGLPVGIHAITLTVDDGNNGMDTDEVIITIEDTSAPVFGTVTGPVDPLPVGSTISVSVPFTDDCGSPHTATIEWGDGSSSSGTVANGTVSGSHTYDLPEVYVVTIILTDDNGNTQHTEYRYVVIYDPAAGFVTGSGWIYSPEGAYVPAPELTGRATFGFVSKYQRGQSQPSGKTQFKFKAGDLDFRSTSYDWLVIAGHNARFKGEGQINRQGNYGFLLTAMDGDLAGGGRPDRLRIKIWDKDNNDALVYDNQMGYADNADAVDAIEAGSIVIQNSGNNRLPAPVPQVADNTVQLNAFPNPSRGEVQAQLKLEEAVRARLEVWNASGQLIRTLFNGQLDAGFHAFEWDGRAEGGSKQAAGLYFLRLSTGKEVQAVRLIITE